MSKPSIAIIGGGAAGLMCAATLLEQNTPADIHLFESNIGLGAKVIISGGGRCNVTTGITDKKMLFTKYTRGAQFLKTAIGHFPPEKVFEWFEAHGVPLKTEADQRVFPVSDDGRDIVGVFEKMFAQQQLQVHLKESVTQVRPEENGKFSLQTQQQDYSFDFLVLTTGGNAYAHTGSKGDGYAFAKSFGHSITPLGPSLNSFLTAEKWPQELSGLSLEDALLTAKTDEGVKKSVIGPMLFTHFGISGPTVFALSSHLAFSTVTHDHPISVSISPLADMTYQDWDQFFIDAIEMHGAQQIQNYLRTKIPTRLSQTVLQLSGVEPTKKVSEVSKAERMKIVEMLTGKMSVSLIKRRPGDEFVTAGGVSLSEVSSKTMQSKLFPHLYFAGELLDVDGVTGGFNLQASWATGRLAGKNIFHFISEE